MLATLTDAPFDDPDWVFEDKYDWFRMVAKTEGGKITHYSRNAKIISHSYIEVARALEGVKGNAVIDGELVAKRADSRYVSGGRTTDWLKIKTSKRQEVVIAGFTDPRRTRPFFGALVLAVREKNGWRYIGHVGTGFNHKTLRAARQARQAEGREVSLSGKGQG
jgi:bifunctional non-homologous end joining protein LigD